MNSRPILICRGNRNKILHKMSLEDGWGRRGLIYEEMIGEVEEEWSRFKDTVSEIAEEDEKGVNDEIRSLVK